ncbi:MAG: S-adenosylmethionine decarboxylase proenzyme [Candidatus Andersenbacteria bacterium RIFCSPHIGHO2_12_FULL_46_9]|uniref:S-adenosylmethionine decarboxylase proenzyme n=1 Tax=Candidatus Daviesbacteria bacterium GW2011_GWF2_38_6 TaxID=1618432 RepID=A0A0G0K932_9BACT|nr:MAG: S-adenosylmethionine decarboxylase proenzyme [Candidatus Daviesbacteria bacterium GW2011_GWF2_38_6]KKT93332.1 MAG: S-adenosylmethionine decarboxylase proenzyme [Parcubacteria group bacterium GW2011_GWA2_45_14]OGY33014.1 MAG: S-adenosylmethionine decarboxylase proenzyme [Candidatus Andersenbacteria bacterium RIFCSPHIGHO2_02_FULL_46_16]OGY36541.1 MAG: S-adenosylmethionine decarboxylase proenzyme [Candidatus Andersenbacteria bacterium RIFCSPHIGHO2_12_FULL_46_9]OGY37143.1 MAG: S-adenosylmet
MLEIFSKRRNNQNRGYHTLIEIFLGDYPEELYYSPTFGQKIDNVVHRAQLSVIKKEFHEFKGFGLTGFYLLSESHLAFHTWPEEKYIAIDLFTCSTWAKTKVAIDTIKREFSTYDLRKFKVKIIRRGFVFEKNV